MNTLIKSLVPVAYKHRIAARLNAQALTLPPGPRAFVFLAADYGNVGDMAITAAQVNFLKQQLPHYHIVTIAVDQTRALIRSVRRQIQPHDLVTLIGGGNMGVMYPDIESLRQLVIRYFPQQRIVCFPQTLDWDDSPLSERTLRQLVKNYARHPNLHVFAREITSYHKLRALFSRYPNVKIGLVPDIVMSVTAAQLASQNPVQKAHLLRCLRADKEAALLSVQYARLDRALMDSGLKITLTDTVINADQLDNEQCASALADKLSQFRGARLVVTDRLHGMIFCLLTGTPCLVLANSNQKIQQTWLDWLQDQPRIKFVKTEQLHQVPSMIRELLALPQGPLDELALSAHHYQPLEQAINHFPSAHYAITAKPQQYIA
ncbi:polysaccharide pyruvyl transferase family protein [Oceanisphaera avium]|uniref:Polysaccharide pyruvyl transferase domain-containing protein n=1 Tax=Oceanisphaera avium TaxID=1903694 RepID=A0A1Y0CX26_9GAMM|nr:polysaccharide pyruvyl transferase family protein [Oceanisphaera avium]ART79893.1 hypothetical protein CBP12_06775 [Oceanisphaera avium]